MQKELFFMVVLAVFFVAVIGIAWLLLSSLLYIGAPGSLMTRDRATNFCLTELHNWCQSTASVPLNWNLRSLKYMEEDVDIVSSCMDLTGCSTCQECGFRPS